MVFNPSKICMLIMVQPPLHDHSTDLYYYQHIVINFVSWEDCAIEAAVVEIEVTNINSQ